ncbi:pyruvate dehydrogenase (acetyl-transferring) E1 component subunit alpha [Nocardioides sp. QY071]|uniref:pyruvate dehydrogenase (acetyl-transferring) E1 component subunit alpha n=1 Tax=Nocardioides sp. QY071 TaxID=3044187 RepID=UPI00249BA35F|nr:pyruvate dehydrogenase (acetyl-transferring) E1 component subunit alpha [Nocardioides sp. QY071]WGY04539.1 pyruvate dehydrogenase (acetyl-transferring) E1 component subunit alpha [Nocardioides sp. QY071]
MTRARRSAPASAPAAAHDHRLGLLRTMILVRRFEERCAELYSATRIRGFLHLCVGEEAVAAGVLGCLGADDTVVSTYRDHGHAIARGVPLDSLMAEMFGRVTGCSRGRGGSMHLFDRATNFLGGNAIVAGGLPLALGVALADHLRGDRRITTCFIGDGAVAEGEFHESLNLAALWHLPLLVVCENNQYAMGTALRHEHARTDLALRASSYGVAAWAVDGMDVLAVEGAARLAIEQIHGGAGPHFLEMRTYRFRAHSMYDPDRYRDKAEIAAWKTRDPIDHLIGLLRAEDRLTDDVLARIESEIDTLLEAAVTTAEAAPLEPVADLTRFTTSERGGTP